MTSSAEGLLYGSRALASSGVVAVAIRRSRPWPAMKRASFSPRRRRGASDARANAANAQPVAVGPARFGPVPRGADWVAAPPWTAADRRAARVAGDAEHDRSESVLAPSPCGLRLLQVVAVADCARVVPVAAANRGSRPPYAHHTAAQPRFAEVREGAGDRR